MSHWAPPPSPERPPQNRDGCLMVGCIVGVLGAVLLGAAFFMGMWWIYRQVEEERLAREGPPPPLVELTAEEFEEQVASGFRQEKVGVDAATLRGIQRFFRDATRVKDKDAAAPEVVRLFDGARVVQEMERSPNGVKLRRDHRRSQEAEPFDHNPFADLGPAYRIVHVTLQEQDSEAIVCGYFPNKNGDPSPKRWWLARDRNGWKLFNWQDCDKGRAYNEELAIMMNLYYRRPGAWEHYSNIVSQVEGNETARQDKARQLESLDVRALDERLFDDGVMRVAFAWYALGDYRRCLELCDLVKRPDIRPHVYRTRTFCLQQLGRWEEAVAASERYERLIGPTPAVMRSRARVLTQLDRATEAEQSWRRVLALEPADRPSIEEWAAVLPTDRKQELVNHVSALTNARKVAQQMVETFCRQEDEADARLLADWLAREAPESCEHFEAQADLKQMEEDDAGAAALYLSAQAKASTDEERRRLGYAHLWAMCEAGQPLEAYQQAPDKRAAIETLAWDFFDEGDYGLRPEHLRKILALHRASDPQDPDLPIWEAQLLRQDQRYDEAERLLTKVIASEKEPDRLDRAKSDLFWTLHEAGKWREAYESAHEEHQLPTLLTMLLSDKRLADARSLVELHRQRNPGDPQLRLLDAELLAAEGKHQEAWDRLPPTMMTASDNPNVWRVTNLRARLVTEGKLPLTLLSAHGLDERLWQQVANRLSSIEQWDRLQEVVGLWRAALPTSADVLYWDAKSRFELGRHAHVVELLQDKNNDSPAPGLSVQPWRQSELGMMLVKSLLQTGQAAAAREQAAKLADRGEFDPLLLVEMTAGDAPAVEQIFDRAGKYQRSSYGFAPYHDREFAALLTDDRYAALRRKLPPSLSADLSRETIILLFAETPALSAAELDKAWERELPQAQIEPVALAGPKNCRHFHVQDHEQRWLVTVGSQPLASAQTLRELDLNEALEKAIANHRGRIAVTRLDAHRTATSAPAIGTLVARLETLAPVALYFSEHSRLALADEALWSRLSAAGARDDFDDLGEWAFLNDNEDVQPKKLRISKAQWRKLTRQWHDGESAEPRRIEVEIANRAAAERLWLQVERLDGKPSSSAALVCRVLADSRLIPGLKTGEFRLVYRHEVQQIDPAVEISPAN